MSKNVDKDCVFCKIIAGEIPSRTVYEDEDYKAILDIAPASKGHVVILPKNHAANIFELSKQDAEGLMPVAQKIASAQMKAFKCDGINILQNNGEVAGQTVFHLHVHSIPRYKDDTVSVGWKPHPDMELDDVYDELKNQLRDGNEE